MDTARHALSIQHDVTASSGGDPYRLLLHVPTSTPPAAGWPLLCLLDGNAVFGTAVDAMRAQATWPSGTDVGEGVIAAIGYPTDRAYDPLRRSWDLSPPPGRTYPPFSSDGPIVRTGGGMAMLETIEADILPWIAVHAPIDCGRRTLFGHSFGGLFAVMVLFTRTALFQTYAAASPALYWEDHVIKPFEDSFLAAPGEKAAATVLLSAGEYEGDTPAPFYKGRPDEAARRDHQATIRTIHHARALADRINAMRWPGLSASFEVFARENHMSVLPVAVNRAVQSAFGLSSSLEKV